MPVIASFLLMAILWTITVNEDAVISLEEMIKSNPPTDIKFAPGRLGEHIVSWSGSCNCTYNDTYYWFRSSYLDKKNETLNDILIKTHEQKINMEIHRGILVQVKLSKGDEKSTSSNWTKMIFHPSRDAFTSIDNLTCVFYGTTYMNCTWNIAEDAPPDAEYFLSYRKAYADDVKNCTHYQSNGQRNVACYGHKYEEHLLTEVNICVSELSNKTKLPYCRNIFPATYQKLDPPINIVINKSTDEVKWELPEMGLNDDCHTYQINITNWSDQKHEVREVNSAKYVMSRDHGKRYSVKIRATVNDMCFKSTLWSEWSKPLNIEIEMKNFSLSTIIAVVTLNFIAMVLVPIFICTKFNLWSKVCQPIPDPKENFRGLFEECDGDFKTWINKNPLLATNPEECIPTTLK
ncbi:interleukin-5 receptor subunit alpha-like isoform X1 [Chiloscyllium plagiosum]|uniref:interleukin-5 receptor subunit alpha-like isoform X1 n=1 Tax=Chiloscyllium plagiosum TaxID=36176 RepID=UPI001CB85771|nr:interleukin-5 receptor subunit alpha-like isoform X1 [Chiloscyllium plagiosum]XP_043548280.1 interleukin-5 receptor subunit alpha-like isoform X1 [Chiloscyllium plagiosum]